MSAQKTARREGGFVLFGVVMLMAIILIIAPLMVRWLRTETGTPDEMAEQVIAQLVRFGIIAR